MIEQKSNYNPTKFEAKQARIRNLWEPSQIRLNNFPLRNHKQFKMEPNTVFHR